MSTAMVIANVSKHFGGLAALSDVSTAVESGSIHAIIGPNGCGKTTLFNIISGIYRPSSGTVRMFDEEITGSSPTSIARRGLARTFQNTRLFNSMTVLENVLCATHAFGVAWKFRSEQSEKAREALNFVGLSSVRNRGTKSLPQGQRRLLEVAKALAIDPQIILLDEPHGGLNPVETERLVKVIEALHQRKLTIVLVEHEMRIVMSLAQRITVLNFGVVLREGTAKEIQNDEAVIEAYLGKRKGLHGGRE